VTTPIRETVGRIFRLVLSSTSLLLFSICVVFEFIRLEMMEGSTEIHKLHDPQVDVEAFLRNQRRTLTLQMSNLAIGRQSFPLEDHKESSKVIIGTASLIYI
jgi:hypothetical protein